MKSTSISRFVVSILLVSFLAACGAETAPDNTAPTILSTIPSSSFMISGTSSNATGVAINSKITAVFSEPMNSTTINTSTFRIEGITGSIAYDSATKTATFTPSASLKKLTKYSVTVTTGVKDTAGNALAADYKWDFITGPVMSAGGRHVLLLKSDGKVWAWGRNNYGQVGDGTAVDLTTPTQLAGLSGTTFASVAGGGYHSLALKDDGTVIGWGYNGNGQLGNGEHTFSPVTSPVSVSGLTGITAIAGGEFHSLALKNDGTVWAWGANGRGQLGSGSTDGSYVPVKVSGLSNVIAIAAAVENSIALKSDFTVWTWGNNTYGQLGVSSGDLSSVPVQVAGLTGIVAVSSGYNHSLALKNDGTVWAWGRNDNDQLGFEYVSGQNFHPIPTQVAGLSGIASIAAGDWHNLSLKSGYTAWAWGNIYYGQLGSGHGSENGANVATPVQVINLSTKTVANLAAGEDFSLALCSDGTVFSWGNYEQGRLGTGFKSDIVKAPELVGTF
ncbi:MAG: Ig-like domain-containing protein [Nitrospirae bacterium]|nr:Ig-like domain-containing protein [Nitrospirota bacterium]